MITEVITEDEQSQEVVQYTIRSMEKAKIVMAKKAQTVHILVQTTKNSYKWQSLYCSTASIEGQSFESIKDAMMYKLDLKWKVYNATSTANFVETLIHAKDMVKNKYSRFISRK